MADHSPSGPVETGASMDYAEHERTYSGFLALAKYGTLFCISLMIFMAFYFYATSGGFVNLLSSLILGLVVFVIGTIALR